MGRKKRYSMFCIVSEKVNMSLPVVILRMSESLKSHPASSRRKKSKGPKVAGKVCSGNLSSNPFSGLRTKGQSKLGRNQTQYNFYKVDECGSMSMAWRLYWTTPNRLEQCPDLVSDFLGLLSCSQLQCLDVSLRL